MYCIVLYVVVKRIVFYSCFRFVSFVFCLIWLHSVSFRFLHLDYSVFVLYCILKCNVLYCIMFDFIGFIWFLFDLVSFGFVCFSLFGLWCLLHCLVYCSVMFCIEFYICFLWF